MGFFSIEFKFVFNEKGELTTPLIIYEHMGNISFLHPKVSNRIKENFLKKRTELDKLLDNK